MSQNKIHSDGAAGAAIGDTAASLTRMPIATNSTFKQQKSENTTMQLDVEKAKEVLNHRKMLLKRMQLCRKATQDRLMLYGKGGTDAPKGENTLEQTPISSRKRIFASKEIERETYADLSKYALNYTVKKAPPIKAPLPAPRNISLRTGSSVGNKMKAAVATLTTNVGWISDASSQSSLKANPNISVSPVAPASVGSSQTAQTNTKNGSGPLTTVPLHQSIPPKSGIQSGVIPGVTSIIPASTTMPAPKVNVKKLSSAVTSTGKHIKKKGSLSGKKRAGKNIRAGNSMSTSEMPSIAKKPLHLAGTKGMGQNGREFVYPPRVLCPETDRLRRKRREIITRLDNLMRVTNTDILGKEEINRKKSKRNQMNDNPYSNGKKMAWKCFMEADSAPCLLPEKRKTQWDYVLEEMRWLATDFVQENKWKKASAKTLSAAVTTYHLEAATKAKLSPPKQIRVSPTSSIKLEEKALNETLVEVESHREDESMEEDSDDDSEIEEPISNLDFVQPTDEDLKSTKMVANVLNEIVENHWQLVETKSNTSLGDKQPNTSPRYREKRLNEASTWSKTDDMQKLPENDVRNVEKGKSQLHHLSFNEIQKQVQKCLSKIQEIESGLGDNYDEFYSDINNDLDKIDLEIQEDQVETLQFTEALWKEDESIPPIAGSIITGTFGCGKTFSTGLLLWRRREKGPQLLICAGASLIRWRHELSKFSGLNVLTYGTSVWCDGSNDVDDILALEQNDVILCDFPGARRLQCRKCEDISPFVTVVVDVRPTSYPSLNPLLTSKNSSKRPNSKSEKDGQPTFNHVFTEDLYTSQWWNIIIKNHLSPSTKCVLVETSGVAKGHFYSEGQKVSYSLTKEKSDIISYKVAFLYHQLFQSKHKTFCRRAFWWAKKRYIAMKKANISNTDLSGGVRGELLKLLNAISCTPEINSDDIEDEVSTSIPKWTVQTCPLSSLQRDSYERACMFVRGSFQCPGEVNMPASSYLPAAKAFLRLRRACFYSDLEELLMTSHESKVRQSEMHFDALGNTGSSENNSSQPNILHAKALLNKSSKLRQLLIILSKECGFDIPSKSYLLDTKLTRRGRKSSAGKKKKVLILASLPEVILLISSFLNAIGIAHERLVAQNCLRTVRSAVNEECVPPSSENNLSWINCQQSIGRFERSSSDSSYSTNVLVSSPHSLSTTSLGLNASSAEVIISLDEDWSGTNDLSTFSILRKNRTNNMQKGSGRKYIKLVSEDTCEHSFLTFDKKMRGKKSLQAMPMMLSSLQLSSLDDNGFLTPPLQSIAAKNILRHVGMPLHSVFFSDYLPKGALHGGPTLFLAGSVEDYRENKDESDFVQYGDKIPSLLNDLDEDEAFIEKVGGKDNALFFGLVISKVERAATCPQATSLKSAIVRSDPYNVESLEIKLNPSIFTRRDFSSLQIQKYLTATKSILSLLDSASNKNTNATKKISKPNAEKPRNKEKRSSSISSQSAPSFFKIKPTKVKPEEIASSLIWYDCDDPISDRSENVTTDSGVLQERKMKRANSYVRSYVSIKRKFDGNQGCESLVYFPPLFPGLIQVNHGSENDYNAFNQSLMDRDMNHLMSEEKKRKNPLDGNTANSKRLRENPQITQVPEFSMEIQNVTPSQPLPTSSILGKDMANDLMGDVDFMDSATDFFDGDFLPDLNITKDDEIINDSGNDAERSDDMELEDTTKPSLDEDFGILGSGLLPPLEDSSKAAMRQHGYSNLYSYWLDPFEPLSSTKESSLNGPTLNSIIVHVKKSSKPAIGMMHRPVSSMQPPSLPYSSNVGIIQSNGSGMLKKKKKNGMTEKRSLGPTTAFVPNSSLEPLKTGSQPPSVQNVQVSKEVRIRPERNAPTLFDTQAHRGAPSIRVQHQLQALLDPSRNQMMRGGLMEPSYQNSLFSSQCSIRELLPDEKTGDAAEVLAKKQLSNFCSPSLVSFGVDFGPFAIGILQESSAKNQKNLVESQTGIKLPMGVKVPKSMGSYSKNVDVWTSDEDKLLTMYVVRFEFNWHVISQALTRKSRVSACLDTATITNPIRSAKLCKERWNSLKLDCINSIGQKSGSKTSFEANKNEKGSELDPYSSENIIVEKRHVDYADECIKTSPTLKTMTRLQRLKKASLKTQHVPLTIPGYSSGTNMPPLQIVPSHPSHSNSVQEAIATSAGPSGIVPPRAEMWPLQFLDLTEKQHQEVEKKKMGKSSSSQMPQHTHPPRQNTAPNPGVHVTAHPHRAIPTNTQMSGQRQPSSAIPHNQQQIPQPKVASAPAYAKQVMPGKRPNTKPGK